MLVAIGTVFGTIAALILLYLFIKLVKWMRVAWKGRRGGWVVHVGDDGGRQGHVWVRKTERFYSVLWRRIKGEKSVREEDEIDAERAPLLGQEGI
jgi:hypothetical protein